MTNQDPKYQAEKNKNAMEYAGLDETDIKNPFNSTCFAENDAYRSGANWATDYWSKRMVPIEVVERFVEALKNIRSYSLGSKADTCDKALAEWNEYKEKMK